MRPAVTLFYDAPLPRTATTQSEAQPSCRRSSPSVCSQPRTPTKSSSGGGKDRHACRSPRAPSPPLRVAKDLKRHPRVDSPLRRSGFRLFDADGALGRRPRVSQKAAPSRSTSSLSPKTVADIEAALGVITIPKNGRSREAPPAPSIELPEPVREAGSSSAVGYLQNAFYGKVMKPKRDPVVRSYRTTAPPSSSPITLVIWTWVLVQPCSRLATARRSSWPSPHVTISSKKAQ